MLQLMQKKVIEEGRAEKDLYEKYVCYCKTGVGDLTKSISAAENKIPQVTSAIEEAEALRKQLASEVSEHKNDRGEAKDTLAKSTSLRAKEASAFATLSSEYKDNILALRGAIKAIEKGAYGSFLQTSGASKLRRMTIDMDMNSVDRDVLSSFLTQSHTASYVPQSGQIVGILKQMEDTMEKNLKEAIAVEHQAIIDFKVLAGAKTKEIAANQAAVESKTERLGQTDVEIVNLKEDLDDTTKSLVEDKAFLADLQKNCATKTAEWEARSKLRAAELLALADTIKILSDDDALELFKKTLPSPSLLQTKVSEREVRKQALIALKQSHGKNAHRDPRMDFIALALRGRGHDNGFANVIKMIDDMVALLRKEQKDDDDKKAYCEAELDKAEDEAKMLAQSIADLEKAIDEAKNNIATLTQDIADLNAGIAALDKQVKEATEAREEAHALYVKTMAEDNAAKELLGVAKNRLAKFYTPKLYQPPAKTELSAMDATFQAVGGTVTTAAPGGIAGTGVTVLAEVGAHNVDAPPPPPETWDAYAKKGQEHAGVVEMMNLLITDLDKEMTQMTTDEKDDQAEYEQFVTDAAAKRASDSKSIADKEAAKANLEAEKQKMTAELKSTMKAAMDKAEYIKDLHLDCDWLVQNFEARKAARAGEVQSLQDAKAVLSGADYALVETSAKRLRGA